MEGKLSRKFSPEPTDPESGKKGRIINAFLKEPSRDPQQLQEAIRNFYIKEQMIGRLL